MHVDLSSCLLGPKVIKHSVFRNETFRHRLFACSQIENWMIATASSFSLGFALGFGTVSSSKVENCRGWTIVTRIV